MSTPPDAVGFVLQAAKPEELDAWLMDRNERFQRFTDHCLELENMYGGRAVYVQTFGMLYLRGFLPDPEMKDLPEGWRKERGEGHLVPALRTPAGKEASKFLDRCTVATPPAPGLPESIRGGLRSGAFFVEQLNGRWYATLGWQPDSLSTVDRERWIDAPLSRYWADREVMDGLTSRMLKED